MAKLTESTSLVRVKKEDLSNDSDLQAVGDAAIQQEGEEKPAPAAAAAPAPVDAASLVPLLPAQANQRPFPPHCPVLCVTPTTIVMGTVEAVFIDLSSETRKFIYSILDMDSATFIATEVQLQWARSCPVWASLSATFKEEACQPCVVEASYQKTRQSEPLYTLVAKDGSLHHGIPKRCILYRVEEVPAICATSMQQKDDSTALNPSTLTPMSGPSTSTPNAAAHVATRPNAPGATTMQQQGATIPSSTLTPVSSHLSTAAETRPNVPGATSMQQQGAPLNLTSGSFASTAASPVETCPNAQPTDGVATMQQQYKAPISSTINAASGLSESSVAQAPDKRHDSSTGDSATVSGNANRQKSVSPVKDGVVTPSEDGNGSAAVAQMQDNRYDNDSASRLTEANPQSPTSNVDTITPGPAPLEKIVSIKRSQAKNDNESRKKQKVGLGALNSALSSPRHSSRDKVMQSEHKQDLLDEDQSESIDDSRNQVEQHQTTYFIIPNHLFGVQNAQALCRRTRNGAIRKLTTQFQLEDHPHKQMRIQLSGSEEEIIKMSNKIELFVYEAVSKDNRERALYALALNNKYRRSGPDCVVYQYLDGSREKGKKWMRWKRLPTDFDCYIGRVIGKGGTNKKRIMKETNCVININVNCQDPHYFVYGDKADDVALCMRKMKQSLQDAKDDWESSQS